MKRFIVGVCTMCIGVMGVQAQHFDNSSISLNTTSFGYPDTATFGQVFTAPNSVLDDWTIYLQNSGGTSQNFEFFLMGWDGAEATGSVLYQSGIQTIDASETSDTAFTVDPNTTITTGGSYVMFINESGLNVGTDGFVAQGINTSFPLGGSFVYLNNGDDFPEVTTTPWSNRLSEYDTAYIADFSAAPVPEPATLMLGLGGLA